MTTNTPYLRLLDANLNRLREGLRVVEDLLRFVLEEESLAKKAKALRHKGRTESYLPLLEARDTLNDCGKSSTSSELNRSTLNDLLLANIKRAQESSRVLEEGFKLIETKESERFKSLRYELYTFEKELFQALCNHP